MQILPNLCYTLHFQHLLIFYCVLLFFYLDIYSFYEHQLRGDSQQVQFTYDVESYLFNVQLIRPFDTNNRSKNKISFAHVIVMSYTIISCKNDFQQFIRNNITESDYTFFFQPFVIVQQRIKSTFYSKMKRVFFLLHK